MFYSNKNFELQKFHHFKFYPHKKEKEEKYNLGLSFEW